MLSYNCRSSSLSVYIMCALLEFLYATLIAIVICYVVTWIDLVCILIYFTPLRSVIEY